MNQIIIKSYFRSIQRGTRTIEDVPEDIRANVQKLIDSSIKESG